VPGFTMNDLQEQVVTGELRFEEVGNAVASERRCSEMQW
jgi:hypothetical protein